MAASLVEGFMTSSKKTDRKPKLEAEATTVCWWSWDRESLKVLERAGGLQLFCVSSSHGEDYNCCCSTISGFSCNALSCRNGLRVRESQTAKNLSSSLLSGVAGEENAEAPWGFISDRGRGGKMRCSQNQRWRKDSGAKRGNEWPWENYDEHRNWIH